MWSSPGDHADVRGELDRLRAEIDRLDAELLDRFVARLDVARQIGVHKHAANLAITDRQREREVARAAIERTAGRCPPALVESLVTTLIGAARQVQARPRIAYLGPATTHSHRAVGHWFDLHGARLQPCPSLTGAVEAVARGEADFAVVPWENRHAGPVAEVHAAARAAGAAVRIVDRAELAVGHVLARRRVAPDSPEPARIHSRPEPLAGARVRLDPHLRALPVVHARSNDEAAQRAAADPQAVAITTAAAARAWGLEVIAEAIDGDDNRTWFVVLTRA